MLIMPLKSVTSTYASSTVSSLILNRLQEFNASGANSPIYDNANEGAGQLETVLDGSKRESSFEVQQSELSQDIPPLPNPDQTSIPVPAMRNNNNMNYVPIMSVANPTAEDPQCMMQDVPIMDANSTSYGLPMEGDNGNLAATSMPFLTSPDNLPYHPAVSPVEAAVALPPAQDSDLTAALEVPTTANPPQQQSHIILVQNSNDKCKHKPQSENTPRRQQREAKWDIMYSYLVQYKDIHKDCLVPNRYKPLPQLGNWVSTQRRHYNAISTGAVSPLSVEKVELLNKLGFVWKTKDPRHVSNVLYISSLCENIVCLTLCKTNIDRFHGKCGLKNLKYTRKKWGIASFLWDTKKIQNCPIGFRPNDKSTNS